MNVGEKRLKLEFKRLGLKERNLAKGRKQTKRKLDMEENNVELNRKRLQMERENRVTINKEFRVCIGFWWLHLNVLKGTKTTFYSCAIKPI